MTHRVYKMTKEQKQNLEEWLNERADIADMEKSTNADQIYLKGAIKALELAGIEVVSTQKRLKVK